MTDSSQDSSSRLALYALGGLVLAGIVLRISLSAAYEPPYLNLFDSLAYLEMAENELFTDPTRAVGYSIVLRGLHGIWADVDLVLFVQHLIGIATGLLLYATVRRIGAPVWVALIAAASVLLSLDQIFLEHALMPEAVFTLMVVGVLYTAVRALEESRRLLGPLSTRSAWVIAAGVLLGASAWTRPVTVPLAPFLGLWLALAIPGNWKQRIFPAALAMVAAGLVVLGYFALHSSHTGFFGFTEASGWGFYSRSAPFADCTKFDPPAGTEALCEEKPPEDRFGPDFYGWQPDSPAIRLFVYPPNGSDQLSAFAKQAILHQPFEYAKDVVRDFGHYFLPLSPPPFSGPEYEIVEVDRRAPGIEEDILAPINGYYSDEPLAIHGGISELGAIQDVLSVRARWLFVAAIFALAGVVLARGKVRAGIVLLGGASALAMLVPVATAIYGARYAIPVSGPLVGAGAIGAWLVGARIRAGRAATLDSPGRSGNSSDGEH